MPDKTTPRPDQGATPTHDGDRMTADRLVWLESQRDSGEVPDYSDVLDWLTELLAAMRAEVGPHETEVKLARALLAWKRLGDRGFGPPDKWEAYEWKGFKLDMAGSEEWFSDLFEAEAVKAACVAADGLAESVLAKRDPEASP